VRTLCGSALSEPAAITGDTSVGISSVFSFAKTLPRGAEVPIRSMSVFLSRELDEP
jgi:protein-disulfide isomerase